MSAKFHISKDGTARQCRAQSPATCRATKSDHKEHYATKEAAQKAHEESQEPSIFNKLEKVWQEEIIQKDNSTKNTEKANSEITSEMKLIENNLTNLKNLSLVFKESVRDLEFTTTTPKLGVLDPAKIKKVDSIQSKITDVVNDLRNSSSLIYNHFPSDKNQKEIVEVSLYAGTIAEKMQGYYKHHKIIKLIEQIPTPKKRTFQSRKEHKNILEDHDNKILSLKRIHVERRNFHRQYIMTELMYIKKHSNKTTYKKFHEIINNLDNEMYLTLGLKSIK